MLNISSQEAATRTRMPLDVVAGGSGVSSFGRAAVADGTGMSALGLSVARDAYKVPTAADAATTAQGDHCAWSHPV